MAIAPTVTARCVHCVWTADDEHGEELQAIREIHELIHPGGTVLVGADDNGASPVGKKTTKAPASRRPRWTRESAIAAIQAFAAVNGGRGPRQHDLHSRNGLPSGATLANHFGNLGEALRAAGLETLGRGWRRAASTSAEVATPPPATDPPASDLASLVELAERFSSLTAELVAMRARAAELEEDVRALLRAITEAIDR